MPPLGLLKLQVPVRLPAAIPKFEKSIAKFPLENPVPLLALMMSQS
jgi:hypothetical protein